jgi:hypothetical protein
MSVANILLHANEWTELQKDKAMLMCEIWNIHLRSGSTSIGQKSRKHCLILDYM